MYQNFETEQITFNLSPSYWAPEWIGLIHLNNSTQVEASVK
jgi:hypothetical protein